MEEDLQRMPRREGTGEEEGGREGGREGGGGDGFVAVDGAEVVELLF